MTGMSIILNSMNIKTKTCIKCSETKEINLFVKRENRCKACRSAYSKEHYKNNVEKIKERSKEYYRNNPEKAREQGKKWAQNNPEKIAEYGKKQRKNNPDKCAARGKRWRKRNPDKVSARAAKRRAALLERIPAWADNEKTEALYAEAQRLTKETGIKHQVDHVIPLQGEFVSGLHVHTNLQILTAHENQSKGNKHIA